jgi:acyl-CoA synthetase (AMP-forming)/AMP-acid ligase II
MGGTTVVMPKFDPVSFLTLAQQYRATHLHLAPPVAVILAKSPLLDGFDLSTVRSGTSGGAPLGVAIIEAVYKRLGFLIKLGYGLSETASVTSTLADTFEQYKPFAGATGVPCPSVEIKVISTDGSGKLLEIEEAGEVLIRSPSLMNGYLNNEAATKEALDAEGWFHTGDVGKLDKAGNLSIVDRLKEVIKVKG